MLAIAVLIIASKLLVQNTVALEAVVALKTTNAVDIRALKNVTGSSSVYRVKPIYFVSLDGKGQELNHQWNYVVFGTGFKDGASQDAFISEISAMHFVELFAGYRLSAPAALSTDKLNDIIKNADPKHFVKRPMKPATPKPPCPTVDLKKGETLKMIGISRNGDQAQSAKLGQELLLRVFPSLRWLYTYLAQVDSGKVWDYAAIMDLHDTTTWCEYFQSQWVQDADKKYPKAMKGVADFFAIEV